MSGGLASLVTRVPALRRIAWRTGRKFYLAARQEQSSDDIATNGEAYLQACVLRAVPESTPLQIIDIGGNQGDWSREILQGLSPARKADRSVHIDIFEPVPGLHPRLKAALAITSLETCCKIHQMAISDSQGQIDIGIMSDHGGTNSVHYAADTSATAQSVLSVEKTSLTAFCDRAGIAHVHLAKSDTEGHDFAVLRGAKPLLAAGRIDVLQFEYNHRWVFARAYLRDVFELIEGTPYKIAKVQPGALDVFDAWHPELERFFQANYAIIATHALDWFSTRRGGFDDANTFG